jgi:hypothetical protein
MSTSLLRIIKELYFSEESGAKPHGTVEGMITRGAGGNARNALEEASSLS